jgi:hypothetical protein
MPRSDGRMNEFARAGGFVQKSAIDAAYSQLIGLCRGILADGHLNDAEIVALDQWLTNYGDVLPDWPARHLAARVRDVLEDGLIEEEERTDLQTFLEQAAGVEGTERFDAPTSLPLTRPAPHVEHDGRSFCLTGTFIYGPRRVVEWEIEKWGGRLASGVARADYLIIGAGVSGAWKFTTHGRKIEEAVAHVESGRKIAIVSESHWSSSLC